MEEHEIVRINQNVNLDLCPVLNETFQRIFVWANEMGLEGKRTTGFRFLNSKEAIIPTPYHSIRCQVKAELSKKIFQWHKPSVEMTKYHYVVIAWQIVDEEENSQLWQDVFYFEEIKNKFVSINTSTEVRCKDVKYWYPLPPLPP